VPVHRQTAQRITPFRLTRHCPRPEAASPVLQATFGIHCHSDHYVSLWKS